MYRLVEATAADVEFLTGVVIEATRAQGRLPAGFDETDFRAGFAEWTVGLIGSGTLHVIEVDGRRAGRLRVVRTPEQVELAGIQLLPHEQSRGLGTQIITDLMRDAGRPVVLSVEKDNPRAQALYRRLGFVVTGETEDELRMRA
ncbi:GNAT family N-acetyltransferase [Actinoplanes sp. LDG1-06]|uniref:GNAT family N-acetyltransferase n=1 Tax=Paractinoplanes ovalisporus TaxID=2810368 RepID=A0ABS2ATJ2_9ACTN|nr:GNAT family N-acetyltransferase [Actinoplanes ovalisporus]MBM2622536.1 GNAT family N-acetyltransferase [Actinoplanes ovalisporus]